MPGFTHPQMAGDNVSNTSVTQHEAVLILCRATCVAARTALGDGLDPRTVAEVLEDLANAVRNPGDVAEDMSPIRIPMA